MDGDRCAALRLSCSFEEVSWRVMGGSSKKNKPALTSAIIENSSPRHWRDGSDRQRFIGYLCFLLCSGRISKPHLNEPYSAVFDHSDFDQSVSFSPLHITRVLLGPSKLPRRMVSSRVHPFKLADLAFSFLNLLLPASNVLIELFATLTVQFANTVVQSVRLKHVETAVVYGIVTE